jgi:hypothetical protein
LYGKGRLTAAGSAAISIAISAVSGLQAALDAKLDAASCTAADVLSKLLTVDGAGSGLEPICSTDKVRRRSPRPRTATPSRT